MNGQDIKQEVPQVQGGTRRIEYIDAMRGFTMFLVVMFHVAFYCFHSADKQYSFTGYLMQVRMPLFFFISGFVLYKRDVVWDAGQIVRFFKKKIPVQLIAPFLFFAIYTHVFNKDLILNFFTDGKCGYWFTFALFVFFVLYATVRFAVRKWWTDLVLVLLGVGLYTTKWFEYRDFLPIDDRVLSLLSVDFWYLFIFFVTGTLVKKHFSAFERLLDGKWLIALCVLFYFLVNAYAKQLPVDFKFILPFLSLTGIVIVFSFFRQKQALFSKQTALGSTMQYVGRRTLDIYLIHFFLIPYNLSFVTFFTDHPMPVMEFLASGLISVAIMALSLLVSNVIRLSPFLAHWLFGAKKA